MNNSEILLYQTEDGQTRIDIRLDEETVWLTIEQMSQLFQKSRSTINDELLKQDALGSSRSNGRRSYLSKGRLNKIINFES